MYCRYAEVVKSCALQQDFSDFVDGDQTEVCYSHGSLSCCKYYFPVCNIDMTTCMSVERAGHIVAVC